MRTLWLPSLYHKAPTEVTHKYKHPYWLTTIVLTTQKLNTLLFIDIALPHKCNSDGIQSEEEEINKWENKFIPVWTNPWGLRLPTNKLLMFPVLIHKVLSTPRAPQFEFRPARVGFSGCKLSSLWIAWACRDKTALCRLGGAAQTLTRKPEFQESWKTGKTIWKIKAM